MRILFTLLCAAPLLAQNVSSIEKAVLAANDEVTRAAEARDADRFFAFMLDTTKGSIVRDGVLSLTPQDARARVEPEFHAPIRVVYHWKQQHVTVISSSVAMLVSEGEGVVTSERGSVTTPFVQTAIWVLRDGAWKILHAHHSTKK